MNRRTWIPVALSALISACGKKQARIHPPPPPPPPPPVEAGNPIERGMASWYGHPYHGRQAADGEIYDMETLVAAHRTLPFQTRVRVRHLRNNKTVDVRIIDRGPFVVGRIIDLSHAAAQAIELIGPGVAEVELTIVQSPANPEPALFGVQVGAFREKANADRFLDNMIQSYGKAQSVLRPGDPSVWRIMAGREPSPEAAEMLAQRIRREQRVPEAFVVRLDPPLMAATH